MENHIRYSAAAVQTDFANPATRREMRKNTDRMLSLIDSAVAGAIPFLPVRTDRSGEEKFISEIFRSNR